MNRGTGSGPTGQWTTPRCHPRSERVAEVPRLWQRRDVWRPVQRRHGLRHERPGGARSGRWPTRQHRLNIWVLVSSLATAGRFLRKGLGGAGGKILPRALPAQRGQTVVAGYASIWGNSPAGHCGRVRPLGKQPSRSQVIRCAASVVGVGPQANAARRGLDAAAQRMRRSPLGRECRRPVPWAVAQCAATVFFHGCGTGH